MHNRSNLVNMLSSTTGLSHESLLRKVTDSPLLKHAPKCNPHLTLGLASWLLRDA